MGLLSLLGCAALSRMLPGPPVLTEVERAGWDAPVPAAVTYTGPPRVEVPVIPLQVWGLRYALDVVLVSTHPDWSMHEYARLDLPSGPLWLAKDADVGGNQGIVADLPAIETWLPEVPAPRVSGPLTVVDHSTATNADLSFSYTNPKGQAVQVTYQGRIPTKPSNPRNGNTMGHSRSAVAVLLDLHLFRGGGKASVTIDGKKWPLKKLLGLYPLKILLAQTQGGFAISNFRVDADTFTLTRPSAGVWPTHGTEAWSTTPTEFRTDGPVSSTRWFQTNGELARAESWQAGLDFPTTKVVFQPALPDLRRPFAGVAESRFVVDIAGQAAHGVGRVRARWVDADTLRVEMIPEEPSWFADRPMLTTVRFDANGYVVTIVRDDTLR